MSENAVYLMLMAIYSVVGGLQIGLAVDEFKHDHLIRGGISIMLTISMILLMAKLIFTW